MSSRADISMPSQCCSRNAHLMRSNLSAVASPARANGCKVMVFWGIDGRAVHRLFIGSKLVRSVSPPCRRSSSTNSSTTAALLTRRSEEHTSELQSRQYLVCRLLLEQKNV